jgi:hypothetical protein
MSTENLSLAWTGDFDSLKKFSNEVLNLDGEWTQPGGDKKLFTFGNSSIVWRKTKGLLLFKGEQSMAVKTKICEAMLQESFNPPSQTHSGISPGDCMDEIESLRSGQLLNGEAIQLLANSVSQISSIIAELQAKAKPSTDDLSEKNTEKSLEEKIEQFEYAKSTNTNTDNPIVIEQSEQLMESNNANSDECTPLIEKNTLEKTLEISDNQEGISTLNGLIDDVSDNNMKRSKHAIDKGQNMRSTDKLHTTNNGIIPIKVNNGCECNVNESETNDPTILVNPLNLIETDNDNLKHKHNVNNPIVSAEVATSIKYDNKQVRNINQATFAEVVTSSPAFNTRNALEKSPTNKSQNNSQPIINDPSSDSADGFIGVDRRRNRVKKFLLSGIAENVKECQIVSYLKQRNITPTYISVFPSKRKGTTSAKIHFRSADCSLVQQQNFWPQFVNCKIWQSKGEIRSNITHNGKFSTYV